MVKPAGAACNLDCSYCFYLKKEALYPNQSHLMPLDVLENHVRQHLAASGNDVEFMWQGGEPMLRGLDFYRRSVELAEQYRRPGQRVWHAMQTNGTLIGDDWAAFFREAGYLVGVSVDGPAHLHDDLRVDKQGRGTHAEVVRGWNTLQAHKVEANILCTVNATNVEHPLEVYRHLRDDLCARYIQMIPIVEREGKGVSSRTVPAAAWGRFLVAIYDEWRRRDRKRGIHINTIDTALASMHGQYTACTVAPHCGGCLAMERNGDVYSCDHYVEPWHKLGNIADRPLAEMVASPQQQHFGRAKYDTLPDQCIACPVLHMCYGGCPKDRIAVTSDGQPGLNWLCEGFKSFFSHIQKRNVAESSRS